MGGASMFLCTTDACMELQCSCVQRLMDGASVFLCAVYGWIGAVMFLCTMRGCMELQYVVYNGWMGWTIMILCKIDDGWLQLQCCFCCSCCCVQWVDWWMDMQFPCVRWNDDEEVCLCTVGGWMEMKWSCTMDGWSCDDLVYNRWIKLLCFYAKWMDDGAAMFLCTMCG